MGDCCSHKESELERLARQRDQRRVLIAVLALNAVMFVLEFGAGVIARSLTHNRRIRMRAEASWAMAR